MIIINGFLYFIFVAEDENTTSTNYSVDLADEEQRSPSPGKSLQIHHQFFS